MPYLEIQQLQKRYAQSVAVESFNLAVERGEFISFLGPSGCGKTTTLRMVAGFEVPSAGAILLDGKDLTHMPPNRRNVGMVFQSYALFPNMTVADNIGFGLKIAGQPKEAIRQRVDEMLALIHMVDFAGRFPYQLSGGQQQRVALARALANRPQVLLLDEPLSALDAKIRLSLRQEIRAIQRQLGITTIYVTHDQEEALSLSDRIVVMNAGRIEQIGTPTEIYATPRTRFVAQFVGTLNLLNGVIRDTQHVEVDGQILRLGQPSSVAGGTAVTVALRPETIAPVAGPSSGLNALQARIDDVQYLGSVVRVRAQVGQQSLHYDTFNRPDAPPPPIGSAVALGFPAEAVLVLP
ncbi:MAG: ABC transporter ATP-binding protein [Roseiflexaceae bacterium]